MGFFKDLFGNDTDPPDPSPTGTCEECGGVFMLETMTDEVNDRLLCWPCIEGLAKALADDWHLCDCDGATDFPFTCDHHCATALVEDERAQERKRRKTDWRQDDGGHRGSRA